MTGRPWAFCHGCKQPIYHCQFKEAGKYRVITENGHFEKAWFCDMECFDAYFRERAPENKFKSIPLKPFGAENLLKYESPSKT